MKDNENPSGNVVKFTRRRREAAVVRSTVQSEPILRVPPLIKAVSAILLAFYVAAAILVFYWGNDRAFAYLYQFCFVPARYTDGNPFDLTAITSLFSYAFLHMSLLHLAVNVISLMAFGTPLAQELTKKQFFILYFASIVGGALAHALVMPQSAEPMLGASGAISGLMGATILGLYRDSRRTKKARQGVLAFIGVLVVSNIFFAGFGMSGVGMVAGMAHIGGFFTGILFYRYGLGLQWKKTVVP